MNKRSLRTTALYTGAFLLFAAIAIAQSKPAAKNTTAREASSGQATGIVSPRDPASGQASGRKSGAVVAADFKVTDDASAERRQHQPVIVTSADAQITTAREASSGMATGRRQHEPVTATNGKSLGSAHATESLDATPANSGSGTEKAASNPLYKDNANQGANPLYQGKDKNAAAPAPSKGVDGLEHSHETVEYKDPEDMTTRYRPGNNKTTKLNKPASSATPSNK